jgi:hypothetical protein
MSPVYRATFGAAPCSEAIKDSLAPDTARFNLWKHSELPTEWKTASTDIGFTAVELPDTPWGNSYYTWACKELDTVKHPEEYVSCMVCNMHDYRDGGEQAKQASADCFWSLLNSGRPPKHFIHVGGTGN